MSDRKYIVQSGFGFFVSFHGSQPLLISDPVSATRFDGIDDAEATVQCLDAAGYEANIVDVMIAKHNTGVYNDTGVSHNTGM